MIMGMTGFGRAEAKVGSYGRVIVEIRSLNHKFQEVIVHLPGVFLSLEEKIKKEIESKIKRGRVTCVLTVSKSLSKARLNEGLIKDYIALCRQIKTQFAIKDQLSINTLVQLPGVLSVAENNIVRQQDWAHLRPLVNKALDKLMLMRRKEGQSVGLYLQKRVEAMSGSLKNIHSRFKAVVTDKAARFSNEEERYSFLKSTDISEELSRLEFHIKSLNAKFSRNGPMGKELDFIAQEMQRETNTIAAKSCDAHISNRVVAIKSEIEKIREQAQNIE